MLPAKSAVPPILLAGIAAYFPLYALPGAESLLGLDWPECVNDLLRQQVCEPLAEASERRSIPTLTDIDPKSIAVMRQYEENPYPRWIAPLASPGAADGRRTDPSPANIENRVPLRRLEILIAGCGTGQHAYYVARKSPRASILAVDLSRASLAYARRKTREAGLDNIEYAQADILKLATIGRTFDRIEAMGVLHHLADPNAGWCVLLSLLRPDGTMRVGLYSDIARRSIVEARALIAERGYPASPAGIRALRRAVIFDPDRERWRQLLATSADFYNTSGCRDLFFNVMENRFTVPQIANFLDSQGLTFLGFELEPATMQRFQRQYPGDQALTSLDCWHVFEMANPDTFSRMYVFSVRKTANASLHAD
jgi:2-polyprenyl-3-methyl-5-hydroxy-6-metoxy-1,4-benzoquinol methylase